MTQSGHCPLTSRMEHKVRLIFRRWDLEQMMVDTETDDLGPSG